MCASALSLSLSLSLFPSLCLFPLSILLSSLLHLSVLANKCRCYQPRRSSGVQGGAALDLSPGMDATIIASSVTDEHIWLLVVFSKLGSIYLCVQARCAIINLATSYLREPFRPSTSLAGYSFRRGNQCRNELGLIGTPPPTVPACVFFLCNTAVITW